MSPDRSPGRLPGFSGLRERGEQLGERLPALLVEAERVAATVAQGVHGRRRTGIGETFWQFRSYQPGDDARSIDWRQSARASHGYFVREQEWEAAQSVWIWPDLSPSMAEASFLARECKRDRAVLLAIALTVLLVRAGEKVALLGSGEAPRTGRAGLEAFCRQLVAAADRDSVAPPAQLPRFSRVVLLSDFMLPVEEWSSRLELWSGRAIAGGALQIVDPGEEELSFDGRVLFEGPEAEGRMLVGNVAEVRARYRELFAFHRDSLKRSFSRRGWAFASHRTDRPAAGGLLLLYGMLAPVAVD
ncbi:hypothetical protein HRbin40_00271 [bacterium HR40]|nr:hypothetical protein HRbin40_00271 [bacterium HR40]